MNIPIAQLDPSITAASAFGRRIISTATLVMLAPVLAAQNGAGPGAATQDPKRAAGEGATTQESELTKPVVVKASQGENSQGALFQSTPLQKTPFSIQLYDQQMMENQRTFTLRDVLRWDPSVSLDANGGETFYHRQDFNIRGFKADNFSSYFIDGMRYMHLAEPTLEDKARVEVLKGPAALRYGLLSSGGAINLVRKRPTEKPSASLHFDVDSFGRFFTMVDAGGRVHDDEFGYRIVASQDVYDSFYDDADGSRKLLSAFVDWRLSDTTTLWLAASEHDRERTTYSGAQLLPDAQRMVVGRAEDNYIPEWSRTITTQRAFSFGLDAQLSDNWSLHASNGFDEVSRSGNLAYISDITAAGDYSIYQWRTADRFESSTHHLRVEGGFATGGIEHDFVAGVEYNRQRTFRRPPIGGPALGTGNFFMPKPAIGHTTDPLDDFWNFYDEERYGVFVTDTLEFDKQWSVLLGLRYDSLQYRVNGADGVAFDRYGEHSLSPTLALMFAPTENVQTYLTYTTGVQYGGQAPVGTTNAGEDLPPIESSQFELGANGRFFDGRLRGEAAIFRIDQDLEYINGANTYVQDGTQLHTGIELSAAFSATPQLDLGLATMFLEADQEDTGDSSIDGNRPDNVPEHQIVAWSEYRPAGVEGLALQLDARAVSDRYADSTETYKMDSYYVLSAGGRYSFLSRGHRWTARLNLHNLTDEEYFHSGSVTPAIGELQYGSPFAATFSLQVDF